MLALLRESLTEDNQEYNSDYYEKVFLGKDSAYYDLDQIDWDYIYSLESPKREEVFVTEILRSLKN